MLTTNPVLVLNQNYEPLNVCTIKRALVLILREKAEMLAEYGVRIFTSTRDFAAPSVIRLFSLIKRPRPRVKLTRKEIYVRDHYTCQYCGTRNRDLTIDHVVPRSRGGAHNWENVVTACRTCNHRKGGNLVQESRLRLMTEPFEPRAGVYYAIERRLSTTLNENWLPFLPGLDAASELTVVGGSSI